MILQNKMFVVVSGNF